MLNNALNPAGFDTQQICYFRLRLMTRLLTTFIFTTIAFQRLILYCTDLNTILRSNHYLLISLPFVCVLALIIIAKYMLYRMIGPRIFKYTWLIDLAFTIVFVVDWVFLLHHQLNRTESGEYRYDLATVVSLLGFSWRTLIQLLMSQHWVFKIIPTLCAYVYVLTFAVVHQHNQTFYILLMGIFQVVYVVLVFYFDHRIHFRLMIGNLKQEQWLQLNEFILNNIPENIVIMDLNGNCKFISEHLKRLMMLRNRSSEPKRFFRKIKDLQRQRNSTDESTQETTLDFITFEASSSEQTKSADSGCRKYDILAEDSLEDLISLFRDLIAKDKIQDKSIHVFDGKFKQEDKPEERSFEINISFINHQFNKHILLILRDTTERDLILTLQGNILYKDHLLASVSHELRTPLNGNINLLQTAIKGRDKCDHIKESILVPALKCSKFLLHMINDILDMSQIKAQKLRLVFQQLNIKETLVNAAQLLEFYAKRKNLTFETEIGKDIPDLFCTDHQRLSQIVVNLMNNAIKNTQKGFVKLSARPLKDPNLIQICIEDSGSGFTEEAKRNLFKDFTQIEFKKRENLNLASFAAGLKITNDLAELLGPKDKKGIMVHSVWNQGSKFSFIIENKETGLIGLATQNYIGYQENHKDYHLPAVPNEIHPEKDLSLTLKIGRNTPIGSRRNFIKAKEHSSPNQQLSCSCAKVLVVDDDPFNIMAYEVILNSLSVKYECVYSGKNAIEKMLNKARYPCSSHCHPYKLVFMDEEMPGMTGTQTVAEIRSLQRQSLLPQMSIIGCSAHHEGEEIKRFLKSGIAEFIPKLISKNVIKKMIDKYGF